MPNIGTAVLAPAFADVDRRLAELQRRHPGFSLHLTGTVVVVARNLRGMIEDIRASLSTAVIVIFVVMTWGFRSLRLGVISVVPNMFPLTFVGGLLAGVGEPLRITSVMTFNICLGLAVNDTIHVLSRFKRERALEDGVRPALQRTMDAVGHCDGRQHGRTDRRLCGLHALPIACDPPVRLPFQRGHDRRFNWRLGDSARDGVVFCAGTSQRILIVNRGRCPGMSTVQPRRPRIQLVYPSFPTFHVVGFQHMIPPWTRTVRSCWLPSGKRNRTLDS